ASTGAFMKNFNTHVYAVVRVKVRATNFSDDAMEVADKVAEAVSNDPHAWLAPLKGKIDVEGHGSFDVECVEFADDIPGVLVDEMNQNNDEVIKEHRSGSLPSIFASIAEVRDALAKQPDANIGNKIVLFAHMRLN